MTQIISSISGYFSKSLILGTFLPVVIFIVLTAIFVAPFMPLDFPALVRFQNLDKEWKTVATSFVAIVLTGLIYNLNIPILRLFEGYPWRNSWLGTFLTRRHLSRFDDAQNRIAAMRACRRLMQDAGKDFTAHKSWVEEFFGYWKALGSPLKGAGRSDYEWLKKIWMTQPASENEPDTQATAAPGRKVLTIPLNASNFSPTLTAPAEATMVLSPRKWESTVTPSTFEVIVLRIEGSGATRSAVLALQEDSFNIAASLLGSHDVFLSQSIP